MDLTKINFTANNAVYHITKGLIFNRNIAFQVKFLRTDDNDRSIKVQNEERLKERIFEKIKFNFNRRLNARADPSNYQFKEEFIKKMIIKNEKKDVFKIQYFHISTGMDDDFDVSEYGGSYEVFPLTFVCKNKKCGDVQYRTRKNIRNFDPNRCLRKGCKGSYEQLSVAMFCEKCGSVRPFYFSKGDKPVRLFRPVKDSLKTWKIQAEGEDLLDFYRLKCNHKDPYDFGPFKQRSVISKAPDQKFKQLTITEGSIFIPRVETNIDIPTTPGIKDMIDLEYLLLAISLNRFQFLRSLDIEVSLEKIQSYFKYYDDENYKELAFKSEPLFIGKSEKEKEELWKKRCLIDKIEPIIDKVKADFEHIDLDSLRDINDFSAIMGVVGLDKLKSTTFTNFISKLKDPVRKSILESDYNNIKNNYHIAEIIHIPSVTLVNTCYGLVHGIDKFYETGFVPHFEPIWINKSDPNKGFQAYSYTYKTEGIMLILNKIEICKWLSNCGLLGETPNPSEIDEFFIRLEGDMDKAVKVLLHTLSHLLMRNSSVYTGLSLQSYGEKIFPRSASIFIYSTSSINIGGLQFIFEHEIINWFENIKFDIKECTLDPRCLDERGACFSCMYIPEFVCYNFNQLLDRDVFLGKHRFKKGFW